MLPVAMSLTGAGLRRPSLIFLGWFGPRGLASILFALLVVQDSSLPGKETIMAVVVATVVLSVFAHGLTALPGVSWYAGRYEEMADQHHEMPEAVEVEEIPTRIRRR